MRKSLIGIIVLSIVLVGVVVPLGFTAQNDQTVITYGETTYNNQEYKSIVDNFFKSESGLDISKIENKVITAAEVNEVASNITHKSYNSNEIYSSALVDLSEEGSIKVTVDTSKITVITADMYISALKTAGITHGHIYVTSPVPASGESALAGVMNSYEEATNVTIPDNVKEAANDEIVTEAEVVENENVTAKEISDLVDEVKEKVIKENITDHQTIVNIIYNYTIEHNLNISNSSIEKIAISIEKVQSVQDDVSDYSNKIEDIIDKK
jgi:uncharacterized protein YpuA (DUF1002 family)